LLKKYIMRNYPESFRVEGIKSRASANGSKEVVLLLDLVLKIPWQTRDNAITSALACSAPLSENFLTQENKRPNSAATSRTTRSKIRETSEGQIYNKYLMSVIRLTSHN